MFVPTRSRRPIFAGRANNACFCFQWRCMLQAAVARACWSQSAAITQIVVASPRPGSIPLSLCSSPGTCAARTPQSRLRSDRLMRACISDCCSKRGRASSSGSYFEWTKKSRTAARTASVVLPSVQSRLYAAILEDALMTEAPPPVLVSADLCDEPGRRWTR